MIKKSIFILLLFFIFIGSAECKMPITLEENNYFYPVADTYVKDFNAPPAKSDALIPENNSSSFKIQSPAKVVLPERTQHPQSQLVDPGAPVSFSVTATGTPPLLFQWQKDGIKIDSATSKTLIIDSVSENDEGFFACTISNNYGSAAYIEAELFVNISPSKITDSKVSYSSKPDADTFSVSDKRSYSVTDSLQTKKTSTTYSSVLSGTPTNTDSIDSGLKKKSHIILKNLSLKAPPGQGLYVHNGDILTFTGTAFPRATLVSGCLTDDQDRMIRDITKVLKLDPETGRIIGSVFVGSFRGAESVHLSIKIQRSSGGKLITGISNTLFVDQDYPEISITEPAASHAKFQTSPIVIYGTASDDLSGIAAVEMSTDGGATFCRVGIFRNNQWIYSFNPKADAAEYHVKVKSTDNVGLSTMSDILTIHYNPSSPTFRKTTKAKIIRPLGHSQNNSSKLPNDDRISYNAESVASDEAELFVNISPAKITDNKVSDTSKPDADKFSVSDKRSYSVTDSLQTKKTSTTYSSVLSSTPTNTDSIDSGLKKKSHIILKNLSLKAPPGQGFYVHNGDILTFTGTAFPHATLVSACLTDDQDRMIRDITKILELDPETERIIGSVFVGSFRGAESVHLSMKIQRSSGGKLITGISNTLFVDQGYPEISITKPAASHAKFQTSPIVIYGTASDNLSGIAAVEISTDGGATFCRVDTFRNNQWLYSFKPKAHAADYNVKVKSTDNVGLSTMSDILPIHYNPSSQPLRKTAKPKSNKPSGHSPDNSSKSPNDDGICTYRIINLGNNRFQPSDMFTIKEQMAIIVKGYGGKMVTVKIIDPSREKVVFELSDYIPANKSKMWKWELSQTGTFQAALFVDGTYQDDIFFKIIQ